MERLLDRAFRKFAPEVFIEMNAYSCSIPSHVHFHILPRKFEGDIFASRNDEVYPALEKAEANLPVELGVVKTGQPIKMDDGDRKPRTIEEMVKEAEWLKTFFN